MATPTVQVRSPRSRRTTGLLMAIAFALIAAGVTLYVAIGHRPRAGTGAIIGQAPIDIGQPPEAVEGGIGASKNGVFQFADKKDQTRVQAELAFATLDPLGGGYYKLGKPRAFIYMRDGRVLHIQADAGRFKMPSRSGQPESGDITGGVLVRMFPPQPKGRPVDPEKDAPSLMIVSKSASFDATLLELSTDDTITASWGGGLFVGQGLLVRLNEVRERLEVVKTSGEFLRLNPKWSNSPKAGESPSATNVASGPEAAGSQGASPAAATTTTSATPTVQVASSPAFIGPPTPPREALYRCLITDNVTMTQRGRVLNADTLELFARTLDNRLPDGAIAPVSFLSQTSTKAPSTSTASKADASPGPVDGRVVAQDAGPAASPTPQGTSNVSSPEATTASATGASVPAAEPSVLETAVAGKDVPTLFTPSADDVVMTWTGPLVLAPAPLGANDQPPALLTNGNDFALRFSTERPGGLAYMKLTDPDTKAVAVCSTIEYAATTRTLGVLNGPGVDNVSIYAPDIGRAIIPSARINLASGVATVPGPGLLAALRGLPVGIDAPAEAGAAASPAPAQLPSSHARQITWTDQADFQLRVVDGKVSTNLQMATFAGRVLARDHTSSISGDGMRAEFAPAPTGSQAAQLRRLNVQGNVVGVAGSKNVDPAQHPPLDPYLRADELDVSFAPVANSDDVEPTFAVAKGNAVAVSRDSLIRAGQIDARLGRPDPKGDLGVTDVVASRQVEFERTDGVFATADNIRADAVKRTADLTGKRVTVGRGASVIEGTRVRLDDSASSLIVQGEGRFLHTQIDAADTANPTKVVANWLKGMVYDDIRGTIDCDGDAGFSATSLTNVQRAQADQIRINITPGSGADRTTKVGDSVVGDRRVIRAEAVGAIVNREGGKNAKIESYRYAQPAQVGVQGPREQVMYIEAPRIVYDDAAGNGQGVFSTPAAGFAIVRDERAAQASAPANGSAAPGAQGGVTSPPLAQLGAARGTSRLAWQGSMNFNRSTGQLTMQKDVELAHLPPGASKATRMVASTVTATFGSGGQNSSELTRAEASGAVYAETGPAGDQQKMVADHVIYDALGGRAEAWADDTNRVTFYQDKRPTPVVAKRMLWDLIKDRVEITEPAPIIAPR